MNETEQRAQVGNVHRIEVHAAEGHTDPVGEAVLRDTQGLGLKRTPKAVRCAAVYLIEAELSDEQVREIAEGLLADPITQRAVIGAAEHGGGALVEVHPLPGVMDPDAEAVELALRTSQGVEAKVLTGKRYEFEGLHQPEARDVAERLLANSVIQAIHDEPYHPEKLPSGKKYELVVRDVALRDLSDEALMKLSRQGHLFLSLDEMRGIQAYYKQLGREPREIELETLAQTWSEHCVHKTLKSTMRYADRAEGGQAHASRPGHTVNVDGSVTIKNLLKSTVAAATHELMADGIDWCLSVFEDNSGVIEFDDDYAVCFKVET
ncbi:MAG TPA: phosphoribosylformylglycinamidine synthase subunit PurS, partial [Phycisphaerales bacterium]|nr:phosphoribosylformylglycinamidine synthase subunit PurS [Phycisphaerales bacterium]